MFQNGEAGSMSPVLPMENIRELYKYGEELAFDDGETLFSEGDSARYFFIVLDGGLRITKVNENGPDDVITVLHSGEFAGELSMLTGSRTLATGRAVGATKVVKFSAEQFRRMIFDCPEFAQPVLFAFAARTRAFDATVIQQEKLAALGKMSAGLAHELNNPAAAMVRSAQAMRNAVRRISALGLQFDCRFTPEQRPMIEEIQKHLRAEAMDPETLTPLERSDREEALAEWLDENGIEDAWELAPGLTTAGMTRECVDEVSGKLPPAALAAALTWFEADLTTNQLTKELEASACRISDLVKALKQYTYMDQAQFQEIDIHVGLDSTLKVFGHKLRAGIVVHREYDRSIPKISAFAGELNQVWTNLISNAIDAMSGKGVLTISTRRDGQFVLVTIADSGPGIPEDVREKIFKAFFTTKPAGQGTGLGLEITHRIVVNRHHGKIDVESKPGDTKFLIRLPLEQKQNEAMYPPRPSTQRETAHPGV